jgi:putative flippase GtrA
MIVYTREKIAHLLRVDFVRFCIVGGMGFVINLLLLALFTQVFNWSVLISQLLGSEIALGSNFFLHHHWTYKKNKVNKSVQTLLWQFHATSWPAIIGSTLMVSAGVSLLHINKFLALIISSAIALGWNFAWSKFVVWRNVTEEQIEEIAE